MFAKTFTALLLTIFLTTSASAEYWGTSAKSKQGDMAMQDVQMDYFAETTYHAFWHTHINSRTRKGVGAFFYAGSAYNTHGNPEKYGKNIYQWSFWYKGIKGGEPREQNITPLWGHRNFQLSNSVGEGANSKMSGIYPLKEKRWYRHTMKFWSPTDKEDAAKFTYVGWWMKDLGGDQKWRFLGLVKVPFKDACFDGSGLGGFIEGFANNDGMNIRTQSFRNLYIRKDNQWESCDFKSCPKKNEQIRITHESGEFAKVEILGRPFEGSQPHTEPHTLKVNQAAAPTMGKVAMAQLAATRTAGNVLVSWKLADDSTPQVKMLRPFGHRVTPEEIILSGDGTRWVTKKVSGDFTFTMRVRAFTNAVGKTDNTSEAGFGFQANETVDAHAGKGYRWNFDQYYIGRYETPTKNFHGLNNQHWKDSGHRFKIGGHFRFSRKGDHFKIEIKHNEKEGWKTLTEEEAKLSKDLVIGPYMSQIIVVNPKLFYRAEFDQIAIEQ